VSCRWARALVAAVVTAGCAGCGGGDTELLVFAASSLTDAFGAVEARFESSHPDVDIVFNFGPSDGLAGQIQSEGTADVFASASTRWMNEVAADPGVSGRVDFARNRLVVVTPADDPARISDLADLADPGVQVVLAAEGVPVGDYAREALANARILEGVTANVVSNEEDAAGVTAKISSGEADAAIVYLSDLSTTAAEGLRSVVIPDDVNVEAIYPIAMVQGTAYPDLASEFLELVVSPEGGKILEEHGFEAPG
jgi:molybdate transport system substrate-binding protein